VTFNRLFTVCAVVVVAGGLILAFIFLGTPAHQREVSIDERRTEDLIKITNAVRDRYQSAGVPERLPQIVLERDPVTRQSYEFRRVDAKHYVLCAVFRTDQSTQNPENERSIVWPTAAWRHRTGRTCYEIDITEEPAIPRRL
jgi:hypothetical protein